MKKIFFILVIFLLINIIINSSEKNDLNRKKIEIIKESKFIIKFKYNNLIIRDKEIIQLLKINLDNQKSYIKAYKGFIGASSMLGLGIGFSIFSTCMILTPIFQVTSNIAFTDNYQTSLFIGLLIGGSLNFIGSITLWITGAFLRHLFKKQKINLIKKYNDSLNIKDISLNIMPNINLSNKFDININVSFKF